jgi:hypothetical protein
MNGTFRLPRLRLRLLLPSIAVIVIGTMVPTGLRHPSLAYIDNTVTADDFVSNLVLYTPLGIALSGSSLIPALLPSHLAHQTSDRKYTSWIRYM